MKPNACRSAQALCNSCGLQQAVAIMPPRAVARCIRCGQVLRRIRPDPLTRPLVLALAGLALYVVVLSLPFMHIRVWAWGHGASLAAFPSQLNRHGFWELSAAVLLFVLVLPPLKLALLALVLLGLRLPRPPKGLRALFRWHGLIGPWSMPEIFLIGFLVAYSRLSGLATVDVGPAVWALGGLMFTSVGSDIALDPEAVWEAIARSVPPAGVPVEVGTVEVGAVQVGSIPVGCSRCGRLCHLPPGHAGTCPRCGASLWPRKPASVRRTWALLIAAIISAVFAYALPVMTVTHFGRGEPTTIVGGMIELAAMGWWPIALLVFIASITIPIFKLVALVVMLLSAQRRSATGLRLRTRIYRLVGAIGRWSMIDVFMVSILTVLVQLGFIGSVHPNGGVIAFGAVVILTMLAAFSFDPRLMWDAVEQDEG